MNVLIALWPLGVFYIFLALIWFLCRKPKKIWSQEDDQKLESYLKEEERKNIDKYICK